MNVEITITPVGRAVPRFHCASCGEVIESAHEANLIWREPFARPAEPIANPSTVHKECDLQFQRQHPAAKGERWVWIQLDAALHMLLSNSGYNAAEAKRAAEITEAI
jgi:hypothetical protein